MKILKDAFKPEVLDIITQEILFDSYANIEEDLSPTGEKGYAPMYSYDNEEEHQRIQETLNAFNEVIEYYAGHNWRGKYYEYKQNRFGSQ